MKSEHVAGLACSYGRSREGAWIEIILESIAALAAPVAPARERGLKYKLAAVIGKAGCVAPARERGLKFM